MEPKIEVKTIGPEEARKLVADDVNVDNRRIDWKIVSTYARQMIEGHWTFVGDPIRISVIGELLDGQHRLHAVIQSGRAQDFVVVSNLPKATRANIDIGRKRTPADVFAMNKISNAGTAAAVANLCMRYAMGNVLDNKYVIQTSEVLEYYQTDGNADLIDRGVVLGNQVKAMLPISPSLSGAIFVIASRTSDAFVVNEFFDKLIEGYDLHPGDAILAYRSWIVRRKRESLKTKRGEHFYMLANCWNSWATNEVVSRVQLPRDGLVSSDQIPQLVSARQKPRAITEDNPVPTHYSRTRKEIEASPRRKKAS